MRSLVAAVCAALLVIPASLALGYQAGKPEPAKPDAAAKAAYKFLVLFNRGNAKAMCRMVDPNFFYANWTPPGECAKAFEGGAKGESLSIRPLGVVHLDGNSALVTIAVVPRRELAACKGKDCYERLVSIMQFTMELSRRLPSSEYPAGSWKPEARPKGERLLDHARWKVAYIAGV